MSSRLLVVEDDPMFARTLVRRLESEGHEVTHAMQLWWLAPGDQHPDRTAARHVGSSTRG